MTYTQATCNHIYDTGGTCNSVAAKDQRYCVYHLRHRARLMRMAKYRARHQRFELKLPPLENMYAVQSALNHIFEAAAAGMIDLKQARFLLSVIRSAGQFRLRADKWQADPYHSDQSAEVDLVAEYGLPKDIDIDIAPEVAFPPPDDLNGVILSGGGAPSAPPQSKDPFVATDSRGSQHSADLPYSGGYCGDHHSSECECMRIRADHPVTPEMVEVVEVAQIRGSDAAALRGKQLSRNSERRRLNRDRKRYAAIALEHNLRCAAERMAEQKLAERARASASAAPPTLTLSEEFEALAANEAAAKKPPVSVNADPNAEKSALTPTGSHG
jgi:hypothetical protein